MFPEVLSVNVLSLVAAMLYESIFCGGTDVLPLHQVQHNKNHKSYTSCNMLCSLLTQNVSSQHQGKQSWEWLRNYKSLI